MKLEEIAGRMVRISSHTITVLNDEGKTAGMVRGLRKYKDIPTRDQMELFKTMRESGLWGTHTDSVFVEGKTLIYLYNMRSDDFYSRYVEGKGADLPHDKEALERRKAEVQKAKDAGVVVIPCRY